MNKETLAVWGGFAVLIIGIGVAVYFGAIKSNVSDGELPPIGQSQVGGAGQSPVAGPVNTNNQTENNMVNTQATQAMIKTNYGDIVVELSGKTAPNTVANFAKLASEKFYDGTKFHRVIKGFMIQGGDPLSKDDSMIDRWGTGGPGYKFNDELSGQEQYPAGTLAMANSGPNTNGSQFFIVTAQPGAQLPPSYTVFGKVISGMETAMKIENVKTGENDRPVEPVIIGSIQVR